ncbi:unnamed protein product [Allacma fusca]|uniref:Uncharacterized protein n=1 Tax=Allacma fusca TaxID=39272 RepID=A0A8J2NW75_9HEXA|nr:unnamed protein product [Allacma fusca]
MLPVEHSNFVPPVYRPLPAGIQFKNKNVVHLRTLNWWTSNAPPYVHPREGLPLRRFKKLKYAIGRSFEKGHGVTRG